MLTLAQACRPRESVFDAARRDSVVDLTELAANRIDAAAFFAESYPTVGMRALIEQAFRRFAGRSDQGTFLLTQAMGGGKTHLMVALGLLARNPRLVKQHFPEYDPDAPQGVKVVAFSGRESDAPLGIWGSIAEQLGKREAFASLYTPLQAPGQTAWIHLLQGSQPVLILLDELPPYFENARSIAIGDSNLATVTMTALSNLLAALCKDELKQVCVVMSDLAASYHEGSGMVQTALATMEKEANRTALRLEPVQLNTDELYHILRTRIFESLPDSAEVARIADGYAEALKQAQQMGLTGASPDESRRQIHHSYPFHFSLRDLYARFRENPGFQQTRGLIRLMRMAVADMYRGNGRLAERVHLVHPYHLNLNDADTVSEIGQVNPTLRNAVSHDIASSGDSVAEQLDRTLGNGSTDAVDTARLLLISSLANVPHALRGLREEEAMALLATPGRPLARLQKQVLEPLLLTAWYLHTGTDNRIFFKDVQNLVAKLKTTAQTLPKEIQMKELRSFLADLFKPTRRDCYQELAVMPALDQVVLRHDQVTLLIHEPYRGGALHPDLEAFYREQELKNRVMFLSGDRGTMERALEIAAELRAVHIILDELRTDRIPEGDPQHRAALDLQEKIRFQLFSAVRECFTRLTYPGSQGPAACDFLMDFTGNAYRGEDQVRRILLERQKLTEDVDSETFRKKCEQRLITREEMPWTEVVQRAAANPGWQWHHPGALESLRQRMLLQDQWRENGGYVQKGPFPPPPTQVRINVQQRSDDGNVTMRLTPVNGDRIHYEVGSTATPASLPVPDPARFETRELKVSFLCTDSTGAHQTGDAVAWENTIDLRHRIYQDGSDRMLELVAAPPAPIRYTTDGSDPQQAGGAYDGPIRVPASTVFVLACAQKDGVSVGPVRIDVPREARVVDPARPARWTRRHEKRTTQDSYNFLERLRKHAGRARGARIIVTAPKGQWTEITFSDDPPLEQGLLAKTLEFVRPLVEEGQVEIDVQSIDFEQGQQLVDWASEERIRLAADEVRQ